MAAAAVALIIGLWSGYTTRQIAKTSRASANRQLLVDLRVKQLNEFYEPLRMLRTKSRLLRQTLPEFEEDGSRWRLVRHIPEIQQDSGRARVVEMILSINDRIEDLLISKAGLMEGEAPGTFGEFMHHSGLLKLAWDHGGELNEDPNGTVQVADVPFPTKIDDDIARTHRTVRTALDDLLKQDPK
jgi:hypothetical protein